MAELGAASRKPQTADGMACRAGPERLEVQVSVHYCRTKGRLSIPAGTCWLANPGRGKILECPLAKVHAWERGPDAGPIHHLIPHWNSCA